MTTKKSKQPTADPTAAARIMRTHGIDPNTVAADPLPDTDGYFAFVLDRNGDEKWAGAPAFKVFTEWPSDWIRDAVLTALYPTQEVEK